MTRRIATVAGHCALLILALSMLTSVALDAQQDNRQYPSARHGGAYAQNFMFPPALSSTPWAPDWAPDGSSIVVGMNGSLWIVDPDTGRADELTYSAKYHSSPDWSADGRWIIYTADDGGQTIQLEILDVDSGESHALTDDSFIYTDPVFSPDGTRVAYVSTKPNGYFNVYIRAIENGQWSGDEIAVTQDHEYRSCVDCPPSNRLYFGSWDMHITPAWFPSGDELLIVSNRDVPLGSGNVLRVPAEANGITKARTALAEQTLYRARPDVSIDGRRFVYSSTRGAADQFNNLYVQPTAGGEPYKLTFFQHDAFHPRWSPDGEWIAYVSNAGGLPQLALLETYGGEQRTIHITDRRWSRPMGVLSVRTRIGDSDQQTGSQIHLVAADGKAYAPDDAYARRSGVGDRVFHTPGTFTVQLPVGPVELTIVKGFEFMFQRVEAEITANEVTSVTVDLEPIADMAAKGWYDGSTHVHMNYGGNLHSTLENLMMMSEAEDQDLVLELVANKDNRILDYQSFVPGGGPHPLSTSERILVVGQEFRPPFYGHVSMFGMTDHLISPFTTGYEGTAIESLYPSNTDMFRKARKQGAWVGYVHAYDGEQDPLEGNLGGAKGAMVDAALGTTDFIEWWNAGRAGFFPMYAIWNNGLRVAAIGGEDSLGNLHSWKLIASVRTYVYTGARGLDMKAWFDGMRDGHAFVSTGPLVELTVNNKIPGETVELPAGGGTVEISARVRSIVPLEKVLLVHNGEVIDEVMLDGDRKNLDYTRSIQVTESGWYHLRAEGTPEERFPLDSGYAQAFTNPVWVTVGDQPVRSRAAAEYSIRWIDKLREMAEAHPGWRSQKERDHVFAQFDEAKVIYQGFAEQAR